MIPLRQESPNPSFPTGYTAGVILKSQKTGHPGGFSISPVGAFSPRESALNRRILALHIGTSLKCLRTIRQVHGTTVVRRSAAESDPGSAPPADAQWTADAGIALTVSVADCCPVILVAPEAGLVGIAHAGWRGAAAGVVPRLWEALRGAGADPSATLAWIGPCAGGDEYEIGPEVAARFAGYGTSLVPGRGSRSLLDVRSVLRSQLVECGVPDYNLAVSPYGTIGNPLYHSHRRDRFAAGRMAAFVVRRGVSNGR